MMEDNCIENMQAIEAAYHQAIGGERPINLSSGASIDANQHPTNTFTDKVNDALSNNPEANIFDLARELFAEENPINSIEMTTNGDGPQSRGVSMQARFGEQLNALEPRACGR